MRAFRHLFVDFDPQLEDAVRAKRQLDAEQWQEELRPRAMRLFGARMAKLTWSRALLKLVVAELFPDDLFTELVGNPDGVARRERHVIAIAVARRQAAARLLDDDTTTRTIARTLDPTITTPILRLASAPSRLFASLRPREAGLAALTGRSVEPGIGSYVMVGEF